MADLLDTPKAHDVKRYLASVLASGGETGLSVGFRPRAQTKLKGGGIRFDDIDLREISITSMQSVPGSQVMTVRQKQDRGRTVYATMAERLWAARRSYGRGPLATMPERLRAGRETSRRRVA